MTIRLCQSLLVSSIAILSPVGLLPSPAIFGRQNEVISWPSALILPMTSPSGIADDNNLVLIVAEVLGDVEKNLLPHFVVARQTPPPPPADVGRFHEAVPLDDIGYQSVPFDDNAMSSNGTDWHCRMIFLQGRDNDLCDNEMAGSGRFFATLSNFQEVRNVFASGKAVSFWSAQIGWASVLIVSNHERSSGDRRTTRNRTARGRRPAADCGKV